MERQIGIAVLGCGYWGINYVRVFSELPESQVVVVCDKRLDRLEEVGRRFPAIKTTTEIEHALELDRVDAVVICTEATTHYQVARRCLAAGKHVLVEEPITTVVAEADELIASAESRALTLMVGHTFLYNSAVRKVKEFITRAAMGRVY